MRNNAQDQIVSRDGPDNRRLATGAAGVALLNDCRDMAAAALARALSKTMDKAVDEFFEHSEQAVNFELRNLYMEAMTLARDKRSQIERSFRLEFMQSFSREARREKGPQQATAFASNELSLVEPDDLEESLASANIANGIHEVCAEELFGIEKRMGVLLQDPDLAFTNDPLGPDVIGKAFMGSMKGLDCPVKTKLLLATLFNTYMPREIKGMYQDINRYLVERGILEKIRVGVRRRGVPAGAAGSVPATPPGAGDEPGLFEAFQALLMPGGAAVSGGAAAGSAVAGAGMAGQPGQATPLVAALTRLQQGQADGLLAAGSHGPLWLTDGSVNVLRELKSGAVAEGMRQVDAMTLDIVAMLFDYILDDRRMPDGLKALIGRLQIPALKVAMLDKAFFSLKSHPARKLLDRLADSAIGWDEAEGHEGGLYRKVQELVERVLNEFDDRIGIFAEVLADFECYLADEKKRADELTGVTVQVVHRRERQEIAKIVAHDEIRRRVQTGMVPQVILDFLLASWESALAAVHAQSGEGGQAWAAAIQTMDDLIWSVAPKREPDDRKKLVTLLPGLLKRLQDGMALAGQAESVRDQFFTKLVKCHADAIKSGLQPTGCPTPGQMPFVAQEIAAEDFAEASRSAATASDFVDIALPQEEVRPDPAILEALSAEPEKGDEGGWESLTISDVPWQSTAEDRGDDYDAMAGRIKRGAWIEFEQDGSATRLKLAWISPLKGLLVFTNRLGERAVSITPTGLAEKLRGGKAQIIDNVALVDRAVSNLMERLKEGVPIEG